MAAKRRTRKRVRKNKRIIRGKGAYFGNSDGTATWKGKLGKRMLTGAATAGGLYASGGNPAAGALAGKVTDWLGTKIWGSGPYSMRRNTLFRDQVPYVHGNSESIRFKHHEYIGDVNSSSAFTTNVITINPGLATSFPYLATIAQNFQEYRFHGLIYTFKSTSANALNSTNTALGSIAMACQYRPDVSAFNNKQQLLNEMWSMDSKPSKGFIFPVECDPRKNVNDIMYVRSGPINGASLTDYESYDLGKVTVASFGSQATAVVGEIWVSYDVELMKPSQNGQIENASAVMYSISAISAGNFFGTAWFTQYDNIGVTVSGDTITFVPGLVGDFVLTYYINGSAVIPVVPTFGMTGGGGANNPLFVPNVKKSVINAAGFQMMVQYGFRLLGGTTTGAVLTASAYTLPTFIDAYWNIMRTPQL